jgi:tripartite-type tricarboxylate transporter receptor subunit TctC
LRALAIPSARRSESIPDIPTVTEFIPGYEASGFWGIGAPRATSNEVIETLNKETNASLADPKLQTQFAELGATVFPLSPGEFRRFIDAEADKWGRVLKLSGAKAG